MSQEIDIKEAKEAIEFKNKIEKLMERLSRERVEDDNDFAGEVLDVITDALNEKETDGQRGS